MSGTVLITGGTGGLGRETARVLATAGWRVVITGRDAGQVADRAAQLTEATATASSATASNATTAATQVVGAVLDLGSLSDVRRFAAEIRERENLDAVICNAGTQTVSGTTTTKDGFEETFGVNHLAHFVLLQELLPHLGDNTRIVFVASGTHDPAERTGMPAPVFTTAREVAYPRKGVDGRRNYTTSKLCNVLTTYELARRLGNEITVNAFDPGLMPGTGLARDYGPVRAFAWRYLLPVLTIVPGINAHTTKTSAKALARLITDDHNTTGRYFVGHKETRSSADSYDRDKASDLWNTSLELTSN